MEIWPALDIFAQKVVRLSQGRFDEQTVYDASDPLGYLKARFGDYPPRLHVVDLGGAAGGQFRLWDVVSQLSKAGVRVQCGGGIRELDEVRRLRDAGVEHVILGSRLVRDEEFRHQALSQFGDLVVASLDIREGQVAVNGWRQQVLDAERLWEDLVKEGFQWAQVTDIGRDGTLQGINQEFWRKWARMPGTIGAGGGISSIQDLEYLESLGVQRAVVGRAWLEGRIPLEVVSRPC